jgi:plastocyanin
MSKLASVLCAVLAVSGASVAAAQESSITGTVKMEGTPKKAKKLNKDMANDKFCGPKNAGTDVFEEELVVGADNAVANVLVHIKKAPEGKHAAPTDKKEIDQSGCVYKPHVVVVHVGQTLTIKNSDDTSHNIHGTPKLNPEFNEGQGSAGMTSDKTFSQKEIGIKIKCDVHPWMSARLHVMDHPFWALTGTDGKFEIKGLPKGTYTVEVWHEKLKAKPVEVTVGDKEAKEQNFTLKAE